MDAMVALYESQPFWIWLALGALILAAEAAMGTEWLLWPAVSAAAVALIALIAPDLGLPVELALFAVLTLVTSIGSRKLIRRENPAAPVSTDRANRLLGQRAQVVQPFVDGRGRVFVSGSEWPADIDGDAPPVGSSVVVEGFDGPRLKVRT